MIRFRDARIPMGRDRRLVIEDWTVRSGECWVITGGSGSGKSSLAKAVAGSTNAAGQLVRIPGMERRDRLAARGTLISFDTEKNIRREIRRNDDSEWSGKPDEGVNLEDFVGDGVELLNPEIVQRLSGRGILHLSTGEFRQVLIAREAARHPDLAVLDEPWEGLDIKARPRLTALLKGMLKNGSAIVVSVNRLEDIPEYATGVIHLADDVASIRKPGDYDVRTAGDFNETSIPDPPESPVEVDRTLIRLENVCLSYGSKQVLDNISWKIDRGESWLLTGPNGSGKTSLLNMISGDEPRAYGQDIFLFGKRKGSGESTAWLQERMGRVSSVLQENISPHSTLREAVGSGLRESFVLTGRLDGYEEKLVDDWLEILDLAGKGDIPFRKLPYGDRRMAMIGRAMIKHPPMLLLDEPMHGLDEEARSRVSRLTETLMRETGTTVLFVSHRPEDAPRSISRHLKLVPGEAGTASRAEAGRR